MTVIAAIHYRNGQRLREIDINETVDCPKDKSEFVWIGISDPTPEEMAILQARYQLHPLAIEDASNAHQLPKLDIYNDQLFLVARTAHLEQGNIAYGETAIFVGHSHIITVRHGSARSHQGLRAHLEAAPSLLAHGVDYVLHAILDFIVDGYLDVMVELEGKVSQLEQTTLDRFLERSEIKLIFTLRRELFRFSRTLAPLGEVAAKLVRLDLPCIDPNTKPYFGDVLDHVKRAQNMADSLREVLTSVFEFSNLLEQQRTGEITRQLAAWAAILAVPTAIAGIYGMNFQYMPELSTRYGYFVVIGVIMAISIALYRRFRRTGWL